MVKTKRNSLSPLFQITWETKTRNICGLYCLLRVARSSAQQTTAETSDTYVTVQQLPTDLASENKGSTRATWGGKQVTTGLLSALCIASYWHLHFLQSSGQHAGWYEKVSFHTCLHRDQPMPIRSNWSHCVKQGYNAHHNESWKQTMKQNGGKELQIKRGKIQLRAGFVSVPVAGLLQQNWLLASHSPVLLLPSSPFSPLGALCFRGTSNAWCWSQTLYMLVARCSGILKWVRN